MLNMVNSVTDMLMLHIISTGTCLLQTLPHSYNCAHMLKIKESLTILDFVIQEQGRHPTVQHQHQFIAMYG